MTPEEYMDPKRFPLSTQEGLDINDQMFIDAINYDGGTEALESGVVFTGEDVPLRKELEEKVAAQTEIRAALKLPPK